MGCTALTVHPASAFKKVSCRSHLYLRSCPGFSPLARYSTFEPSPPYLISLYLSLSLPLSLATLLSIIHSS